MYFNPPQNNHNDFYHPLNQVNEEKQFKARIAFMGEPKDNARDMRAAGRMKMYDTATERDVPSKRKSTVFDITFKSERQFNQFMGAYDVEFLDRLDEAVKTKIEKTRQGFQVMVFSPTVKKFIPQGSPHKTRAAAEKDAKMFEGNYSVTRLNEPHRVQKKKQTRKAKPIKDDVQLDESRDDFDYLDAQAASEDRAIAGKKFMDALKKAGIKAEYVRSSGTMRVAKKDLRKAQGIGKKLKVDRDGVRMDVLREGVQLDEKKKPISTRLGDAFDSGELEDRIKSMSGPARKSFTNLANSLVDFYHSMSDIHQVDGRQLEDKIDGSPPRVRKMFAKLLDEDVQIDEVTGETTVMAKSDRNQYERITRALTAANRTGKIKGYEGAHFNERTGMLTLIFDSKAHKPASQRRMVAKMIKDFGLEFSHSVEEGFASDAQRRAAFASGYKAKGKKKKNEEEEVDEADINLPNKPKNAIRKPKIDSKPTMKEGLRQAMSPPTETSDQKQKRKEKDNFDLYKKRQARISALRGDRSSRQLTPKQQKDYEKRVNLDQLKALDPGGKRKK